MPPPSRIAVATTIASTAISLPCAGIGQQMSGDPSHPGARRHDLGEASGEHGVDRLVNASAPVELDQHDRRDADGRVAPVSAAHGRPNPIVSVTILSWASKRRDRLAVED